MNKQKKLASDGISEAVIYNTIKHLQAYLLKNTIGTSADTGSDMFKANHGCFKKFKRRIGIHSVYANYPLV